MSTMMNILSKGRSRGAKLIPPTQLCWAAMGNRATERGSNLTFVRGVSRQSPARQTETPPPQSVFSYSSRNGDPYPIKKGV